MPSIELHLRTYPAVLIDGRAAPLALKRGLALLAVLSELGRKVQRSQLGDLLWPDVAADVARARLRRLVHETNQVLGIDAIVGDGDALWFAGEAGRVASDVERTRGFARRALAAPTDASGDEHPHDALDELLQPDAHQVLDGFTFGADTFDEWLEQRRAEQHRLVARALQRVGEQWLAQGHTNLAADAAARLVALEPLADAGHALLLQAHAQRGDVGALESSYVAFAELLRRELGVRLSPSYEALYASARRHVMQAADAADAVSRSAFVATRSAPSIRFADAQDAAVAYLELGRGPQTMVMLFGLWSHVEVVWEEPSIRAVLERLARRFRVVLMDRRGMGLSDRIASAQSVPAGVDDVDAVRRGVGADKVWLFGSSVGSMVAIEYAAAHPDAVDGLLLYGARARGSWAPDYPWAPRAEQLESWLERLQGNWGGATSLAHFAPSQADDPAARDWWARCMRQAMSRNGLPGLVREYARMDVRDRLAAVRAPTLVLQREGDRITRPGGARYLAEHIRGATLAMLPGVDHNMWAGDVGAVIDEVERFVTAAAAEA